MYIKALTCLRWHLMGDSIIECMGTSDILAQRERLQHVLIHEQELHSTLDAVTKMNVLRLVVACYWSRDLRE